MVSLNLSESAAVGGSGVVYRALNGYDVTVFDIVVQVILVSTAVWIVVLNGLVIHTLVGSRSGSGADREPTDWLVASLSMADTVTGLFLLYHSTYNLTNFQIRLECLIRTSLLNVALFSSSFHLALLTADRYTKIIVPYRYNQICNGTTVVATVMGVWILSVLLAFLPTMGWNNADVRVGPGGEPLPVCSYMELMHPGFLRLQVCLFFVPVGVMLVLYAHIFKVAHRHARLIAAQEGSRPRTRESHSWKYTKTVLVVVGLYFVSWLPMGFILVLNLESYLDGYTVVQKGVMMTYSSIPAFLNSLTNPIVYAFKISAVRNKFRAVFCKCKLWRRLARSNKTPVTQITTVTVAERFSP